MSAKSGLFKVSQLSPHLANKRHKLTNNENEAIRTLLTQEKKHRVLEMARDIVELENRIDPSSRLIITEDTENPGHYIVLEGNRRITAIKTLTNPTLAKNLPTASEFKKLSTKFLKKPIKTVDCVVLPFEEAKIWIKRKHYNGMGGAGTVEWDPIAKAKSDAEDGKFDALWLTAVRFLESNGYDAGYIEEGIEGISSTVDRLLASSHMRELLGVSISKKDGSVAVENGNKEQACEILNAIFQSIIENPNFKEPTITTAELQKVYLQQFLPLSAKKNPPKSDNPNGGKGPASNGNESGSKDNSAGKPNGKGDGKSKPKKERETLAAKGLNITPDHLRYFYDELCKLKTAKHKHASAALLRVFLEKATMVFLLEMGIKHPDSSGGTKWTNFEVKLRDKVKAALAEIDPKKKNDDLKYARDIANGKKDGLHCLDILNDYIHSTNSLPASSELITTWDRLHPYYKAMFEALEVSNA